MIKRNKKICITIDLTLHGNGYMYYVNIYCYSQNQLYSRGNLYPIHQIYHVYAIPVYFGYDEQIQNAHQQSLPVNNDQALSEILNSNVVSIYANRLHSSAQTTNSNANPESGSDLNQHSVPDFNHLSETINSPDNGQHYGSSALPSPHSRSPYDYTDIRHSSGRSSRLSEISSPSTGYRHPSSRYDISAVESFSSPSGIISSTASSHIVVSGARSFDPVSNDDYVQFPRDISNNSIYSSESNRETNNAVQEETECQRVNSNRNHNNYYQLNGANGTDNHHQNVTNTDNGSGSVPCSEDNIPSEATSFCFEPANQFCFDKEEQQLNNSNIISLDQPLQQRNQLRRCSELFQHSTRPPDGTPELNTKEGFFQLHRNNTERVVLESLDRRVVQRMMEKGYTEGQILGAAVYFYKSTGHLSISVSKLVDILETSHWQEIFEDFHT